MSTLRHRAQRAIFIGVAALLGLSLFAPMVALADEGLVPGQPATVQTGGGDASLRIDPSHDAEVLSSVPDGTSISILKGPVTGADGSLWYSASAEGLTGYISTDMVTGDVAADSPELPDTSEDPAAAEEDPAEAESDSVQTTAPAIPWQEPVDFGVVVDNSEEPLPAEGLACRMDAQSDAEVIVRLSPGNTLEVTGDEVWAEGIAFLPVNCAGVGGFVRSDYVQLDSEAAVVEEPEAVIEDAVTEDPVAEDIAPEETVAEETAEDVVPEVEATEEVVVEEGAANENAASEEAVTEDAVTEDPVAEDVAPEETATEETAEDVVPEETAVEEEATGEEADGATDEVAVEEDVTPEPVVEEVATEETAEEIVVEIEATEEVVEVGATEEVVEVGATEEVVEVEATEEVVVEEEAANEDAAAEEAVTDEGATEEPLAEEVVAEATPAEQLPAEEVSPAATEEAPTEEAVAVTEEVATEEAETEEPLIRARSVEEPAETVVAEEAEADTAETTAQSNQRMAVAQRAQSKVDLSPAIGTAEVIGTNGDGVRCRTAAAADAPTITVLAEGTIVQILSVERNGYLGVICGGQEGFAIVDFLWSGGAGDEIAASAGSVTVVGTGGGGLNCRSGPGTSYGVLTLLRDGTTVSIRGASSNGWAPVVCGGQNGYISIDYAEATGSASSGSNGSVSAAAATMTVTGTNGDGVRCRTRPSTSSSIITVLAEGTRVSTRGAASGGWVPVTCGGTNGYISAMYLGGSSGSTSGGSGTGVNSGYVRVTGTGGGGLRCRTTPTTSGAIIMVIAEGRSAKVRGAASNGWQPVICGGRSGFVSTQFITGRSGAGSTPAPRPAPTPPPATSGMVNGDHARVSSTLNLRYSASMGAGIATTAPTGTVVLITGGVTNGFYPVNWDGLRGFMSRDYLSKTNAELSERGGSGSNPAPPPSGDNGGTASGNSMSSFALRYEGYPYVWATSGPSSFDCSGFTYWVTKNVTGKDIGTGLWTQVSAGRPVGRSSLQPGDLVFFQNTYKAGLSHSGVYIGNNRFIHAENETTGVRISDINSTYYSSRWYGAVRMT